MGVGDRTKKWAWVMMGGCYVVRGDSCSDVMRRGRVGVDGGGDGEGVQGNGDESGSDGGHT